MIKGQRTREDYDRNAAGYGAHGDSSLFAEEDTRARAQLLAERRGGGGGSKKTAGGAYLGQEEQILSLEYMQQALERRCALHGKESVHDDIATTLDDLGRAYLDRLDHASALDHLKQALDMYRTLRGQEAIRYDIARTLHNIGCAYFALQEHVLAYEHLHQALVMQRALFEFGRKVMLKSIEITIYNLFVVQEAVGDVYAARVLCREELCMCCARHGSSEAVEEVELCKSRYSSLPRPSSIKNLHTFVDGLCCNLDCLAQLKIGPKLIFCSVCNDVRYCSLECKMDDSHNHKQDGMCVEDLGGANSQGKVTRREEGGEEK